MPTDAMPSVPPKRATPPVASASRSMCSTRGASSTGCAVAIVTFSARPHAGVIASGRKPYAVKRRVKASIVCASTGSAALIAMRHDERSRPSISSSGTRCAHSVYAKLGAHEIAPR
jgi:hypothetical protein